MKWLGKVLAAPIDLVRAPIRAVERVVDPDDSEDSKVLSMPLEVLAEEIRKVGK